MDWLSTRDASLRTSFGRAVEMALAADGGLIVPQRIPELDTEKLTGHEYAQLAFDVLHAFVPELDETALRDALETNYRDFPIPVVNTPTGTFLELFHGPTGAFKDVALTMLPRIDAMVATEAKTYVTATSGDTGKAALEAFRDKPGAKIMVFYPEQGVSHLQKLQMQTQTGDNVAVLAIRGNFDDAQRGVKALLEEFAGQGVSSCNSINIARLLTQVPYYFHAANQLGSKPLSFIVPSGNFGDILAGWYARAMGLAVDKLIVATNENNVLADFIRSGTYDRRRELVKTTSPSMDILVSSNVERLLYHLGGPEATKAAMAELKTTGSYQVDPALLRDFDAGSASESEVRAAIREVWETAGYLMDPHTACAWVVWDKLGRPADHVILATASPFKFPLVLQQALTGQGEDEAQALAYLSTLAPTHPALAGIFERPRLHERVIDAQAMREEFIRFKGDNR